MNLRKQWLVVLGMTFASAVQASDWNTSDYDLYPGDFNGDGRADMLYVAKSPDKGSGIAISNGSQVVAGEIVWNSIGFGIPWHSNIYKPVVGDFNWDGRADIFMQRQTPGNHYLLLANEDGSFSGSIQEYPNLYLGQYALSGDEHRIISVKAFIPGNTPSAIGHRLFLQAARRGGSNLLLATSHSGLIGGVFGTPWTDGYLGFQWNFQQAVIHSGDFNGDNNGDLLVQAKPDIILIDYEIPIPVPRYRPYSFGIVFHVFGSNGAQAWDRIRSGVDWSAATSNLTIGDFNGDFRDDVIVQPKSAGSSVRVVRANSNAPELLVDSSTALDFADAGAGTGQTHRLIAGSFAGGQARGIYLQTTGAGGTDLIAHVVPTAGGTASTIAEAPQYQYAPTPGTAVGAIQGQFGVDPSGAATYQIPLELPPGIAGLKPDLALSYSSRSGNGLLGVGWSVSGLSAIARCGTTYDADGFTDGVDFDDNDRYCLDGQRLVAPPGMNGVVNAAYRTEIESFQDVVSVNGSANDPAGWKVRDKAGLTRYYGYTTDSRMQPQGRTEASVWAVNKIVDRYSNFIEFSYTEIASESNFVPLEIIWGSEASGRNVVGRVRFEYSTDRSDVTLGYLAGGVVKSQKRLQRVDVFSRSSATNLSSAASTLVRSYYLKYQQSPTSALSHIKEIIACDAGSSSSRRCVGSTKFDWQYGTPGFGAFSATGANIATMPYMRPMDVNGDGRTDFAYLNSSTVPATWYYRLSTNLADAAGISTGVTTGAPNEAVIIDYNSDGFDDILEADGYLAGGQNGISGKVASNAGAGSVSSKVTTVGDFDGDGTQDLLYAGGSVFGPADEFPYNMEKGPVTDALLQLHLNQPGGFEPQSGTNFKTLSLGGVPALREGAPRYLHTINFDNDGRDDLLIRVGINCRWIRITDPKLGPISWNCSSHQYRVYSYEPATQSLQHVWSVSDAQWQHLKVIDTNGDGLTDILYATSTEWILRLGTGSAAAGLLPAWSGATFNGAVYTCYGYDESGNQQCEYVNTDLPLNAAKLEHAQILDHNRDGRSDVMFPGGNNTWIVLLNNSQTTASFSTVAVDTQIGVSYPESAMLVERNGDGIPDFLVRQASNQFFDAIGSGPAAGLLTRIMDGYGAVTQVQHVPLTDRASNGQMGYYKGKSDFLDDLSTDKSVSFPYFNIQIPMTVVSQISQDNGLASGGAIRTGYLYEGLKAHRRGRGMLGFSRVVTQNLNTNIVVAREFAQRWPLTGLPLTTTQRHPSGAPTLVSTPSSDLQLHYEELCDGNRYCPKVRPPTIIVQQYIDNPGPLISSSTNSLSYMSWTYPGQSAPSRWFPQVLSSTDIAYPLNGTAALKRTKTEYLASGGGVQTPGNNAHDDYGNPKYIKVTVDDGAGGDEHVTSSEHFYTNDATNWCLGRLTETRVAHSKQLGLTGNTGAQSINRKSTFTYKAAPTCSLETETIEPDVAAVKQLTTHEYDEYGNRKKSTTQVFDPSAPSSRVTSADYLTTQGQFPAKITNALGHEEVSSWDPRFGTKTDSTGPNGISSHVDIDTFGVPLRSTPISAVGGGSALGVSTETKRAWCGLTGCYDTRSVMYVTVTGSDGSQSRAEFDRLGRETHSGKIALDGRWLFSEKHYDPLGRTYAASHPYFDSSKKCWSFSRFDLLNRVTYQRTAYKTGDNSDSECSSTVPAFDSTDASLPGGATGGRVSVTTYDYRDASLTGAKVVNNPGDTVAQRIGYKWVDAMGRTRAVQDEFSANGCNALSTTGNSACLATFYDHDAQGNLSLVRRKGMLANGSGMTNTTVDTHVSFNVRGFKTGMIDPDMGTWGYGYNGFGELISQIDAKNQTTTLTYDQLGRMRTRTETGEGETTWNYDQANYGGPRSVGKLTSVTAPGGFEERYAYDNYGRAETTKRLIDGNWYRIDQTYDSQSRISELKYPSWNTSSSADAVPADADRVRVNSSYNAYGYLTSTQNSATGTTLWRVDTIDLFGVTQETLGNGVVTRRVFEATTGYLRQVQAGLGSATIVQNQSYTFDRVGNVLTRGDVNLSRSEDFTYDSIDRLSQTRLFNNATANGSVLISETVYYDDFGNIKSKGADYGAYDYAVTTTSTCGARAALQGSQPHAVRKLNAGASTRTLCYDANGNVTSQLNGQYDSATWTVANLAKHIAKGANYADFSYGPDRARFKQVAVQGGVTATTLYVGGVYEKTTKAGVTEHTYFLKGGGGAIAIHKRTVNGASTTQINKYLHRDHLGSVVALSDDFGVVSATDRMSFDAWGKRRANTWTASSAGTQISPSTYSSFTNRGYTGHEHLDFLGVIHMNGRVYDSEIGRFLSADPFVQFPQSTQGFNRYSYVDNNPLAHTDPSGFFSLSSVKRFFGAAFSIIGGILGTNPATLPFGFLMAAIGGFISGGGQGAIFSVVSFGVFAGVGGITQWYARALVSGVTGGMMSAATGGNFGDGFIGAAAGSLAGSAMKNMGLGLAGSGGPQSIAARIVIRAIAGGTVSAISGGSFANGAIAAAFAAAIEEGMERRLYELIQSSEELAATGPQITFKGDKALPKGELSIKLTPAELKAKLNDIFSARLTKGGPKIDADLGALTVTVDRNGNISVSAGYLRGTFSNLGSELASLGIGAGGFTLTFSDFSRNSISWKLDMGKARLFGYDVGWLVPDRISGNIHGSFTVDPNVYLRSWDATAPAFRALDNQQQRLDQLCADAGC